MLITYSTYLLTPLLLHYLLLTADYLLKGRISRICRLLFVSLSPAAGPSIQQPPVLGDLQLQSGLDIQQHLVLLSLALQVGPQLHQLLLQARHLKATDEEDLQVKVFTKLC